SGRSLARAARIWPVHEARSDHRLVVTPAPAGARGPRHRACSLHQGPIERRGQAVQARPRLVRRSQRMSMGATLGQVTPSPLSRTNIFAPVSAPAQTIFDLSLMVIAIAAAIFVIVGGLIAYSVVKFRKRRNDDGREPAQVYGSQQVELAWTIIPV